MSWGLGGSEMIFNDAGDHLRHHYTYTVMDTVLLCLCTLINPFLHTKKRGPNPNLSLSSMPCHTCHVACVPAHMPMTGDSYQGNRP
jgi:hypothetical protein